MDELAVADIDTHMAERVLERLGGSDRCALNDLNQAGFPRLFPNLFIGLGVGKATVTLEQGVAALQQILGLEVADLTESIGQCALEKCRHLLGVTMRATDRFTDDFVNQAHGFEPMRSDAQRFSGILGFFRGLP